MKFLIIYNFSTLTGILILLFKIAYQVLILIQYLRNIFNNENKNTFNNNIEIDVPYKLKQ